MCLHKNLALSSVVPVLILIWVSTMCESMVAFSTRQKSTTLNSYKSLDAAMRKYFCHSLLICAAWRTISGEAKLLFHTNNSKTSNKTTQMHFGPKFRTLPKLNFKSTTAKPVTRQQKCILGQKIRIYFFSKTWLHTNNSKNSNKRTQKEVRPKNHRTFPKVVT